MYSSDTLCLFMLVMVLGTGVPVDSQHETVLGTGDSDQLIQWPTCHSYIRKTAVVPGVFPIYRATVPFYWACNQMCSDRSDCGAYWYLHPLCNLYNINDNIVNEYFNDHFYLDPGSVTTMQWYSKTCEHTETDQSCDEYGTRIYEGKEIDNLDHWLTSSKGFGDVSAADCQRWCTLYPACKSVTFVQHSPGVGICRLYIVTIQELIDSGRGDDVGDNELSTTYDRHCCPPYQPPDTEGTGCSGTDCFANPLEPVAVKGTKATREG